MNQVTDGMSVTGLTVTHGTTPERFTGTVLGVLQDGIAPGFDMIMVRLQGSQITDSNGNLDKGVWAGMSGSPVYDANGRLLGSVSYTLSYSPSEVAGITPATEMYRLLQSDSPATRNDVRSAHRVPIPAGMASELVASHDLSAAQAGGGFRRLPMPLTISGGFNQSQLDKLAKRFHISRPVVAGGSAPAAGDPAPIVPGGNLVASLSYGDITYAGTGTATAVCNGKVLGFGHPLLWTGHSTYSMHNANALYIQRDELFGSFKVSNPTAPLGGIFQDRLEGILGTEAVEPQGTDVTSHVTATNGRSRDGETVVTYRPALPYLSAIHLFYNALVVLDKYGAGTAHLTWTANGTREDGSSWRYRRTNTFASRYDIAFSSVFESYFQLRSILHNDFERVDINNVHFNASYDPKYAAQQLDSVQARVNGEWVSIGRHRHAIKVPGGSDLRLRATLIPSDPDLAEQMVRLSVPVPAKGRSGYLNVSGGGSNRYFYNENSGAAPESFSDLLKELSTAPRNDELVATLFSETPSGTRSTSDSTLRDSVVKGRKSVEVRITH